MGSRGLRTSYDDTISLVQYIFQFLSSHGLMVVQLSAMHNMAVVISPVLRPLRANWQMPRSVWRQKVVSVDMFTGL